MKELIEDVRVLVNEEAERSMVNHPLFNSTHEGYAVIKEEIEEVEAEFEDVKIELQDIWYYTKRNNQQNIMGHIENLRKIAINLAAEAIQVSAMAQKFIDSCSKGEF